ncbi:hypothetical protein BDW02DRAFT_632368 [Decorospora gaudefroyi]|uniref:Tat pathway signal sequence n=1 Tax=Decorospora gaudefroyi TaxID=184978 RepID=A0A6A5K7K8_9PLEO|nr:hypothetical protein BDW02DRAFT_632368 [Decorospora gaudefroyi]
MEKYTDSSTSQPDSENAAFLPPQYQTEDPQRRRKNYVYLTLFNLFLFTLSMLSLICAVMSQKDTSGHSAAKLMDQFGIFSPAMHIVEYEHTTFSLPHPLNSSKYVGITDDVENAWMDIAYLPDQMVSKTDFPKLHKPADALQVTDPRTGETGYRVGLEVFHQLHCLNLLRMATYPEHYTKLWWSDTNDKPEKVRAHLDHCIEILRMNLMCLSDVNVFTFHEREGRKGYWPDYESDHVCRNFEKIKGWANENAMPEADV